MAAAFGLFCLVPEETSSFHWSILDSSNMDNELLIYEDVGVNVLQGHCGVRYGDGYLCYTTYAIVFACRMNFGPYVEGKPVLSLPPMTIGWPHQVILVRLNFKTFNFVFRQLYSMEL